MAAFFALPINREFLDDPAIKRLGTATREGMSWRTWALEPYKIIACRRTRLIALARTVACAALATKHLIDCLDNFVLTDLRFIAQ